MSERKGLSQKTRFEVFKRDKFTCQYCGRSAPEVILEVDHVKPVAKGGTNDIMNLVTACWECNHGKGAKELSDDSTIKKQQAEMLRRAEYREQLSMMADWRKELIDIRTQERAAKEQEVEELFDYACKRLDREKGILSDTSRKKTKLLIKKYGFETAIKAIDEFADDGNSRHYSYSSAIDQISKYAFSIANPNMHSVYYLRKIILNRFPRESEGHENELAIKIDLALKKDMSFYMLNYAPIYLLNL